MPNRMPSLPWSIGGLVLLACGPARAQVAWETSLAAAQQKAAAAQGRLTRGEVEWLIAQGVRKLRPEFAWQAGEGWRAPRQAVFDKVATTDGSERPASDEEVAAAIEELKKTGARRPSRDSFSK